MALQLPQFQRISFNEANPWLVGAERGQQFAQSAMQFPQDLRAKMLANEIAQVQAKYAEPNAAAALKTAQQHNQYDPRIWESEIGLRGAHANEINTMLPGRKQELELKNRYYPQQTEAEINYKNQMAKFGGGLGVGAREEVFYQNLVGQDNPHFNPQQIYEASNALRQGKMTLQDGTPINFSPAARDALDRITKYGTTSQIINQSVSATQAEAEMPVFKKYIDEGIKPYGTTIFNTSPQQIKDALNVKDHAAQQRLGKYMAAQQLSYDRAALSLRINSLPPGVTIADEIKKLSYASVNEKFPTMSAEARQIASDEVAKALKEALKARRSVGTGASSVRNSPFIEGNNNGQVQGDQGYISADVNAQTIRMQTPDGRQWDIPIDKVQQAVQRGARQVGGQ